MGKPGRRCDYDPLPLIIQPPKSPSDSKMNHREEKEEKKQATKKTKTKKQQQQAYAAFLFSGSKSQIQFYTLFDRLIFYCQKLLYLSGVSNPIVQLSTMTTSGTNIFDRNLTE